MYTLKDKSFHSLYCIYQLCSHISTRIFQQSQEDGTVAIIITLSDNRLPRDSAGSLTVFCCSCYTLLIKLLLLQIDPDKNKLISVLNFRLDLAVFASLTIIVGTKYVAQKPYNEKISQPLSFTICLFSLLHDYFKLFCGMTKSQIWLFFKAQENYTLGSYKDCLPRHRNPVLHQFVIEIP